MKWLRLIASVLLFPLSLAWYRTDVGPGGVSPRVYWLIMATWIAANVAVTIYVMRNLSLDLLLEP